MVTQHSQPLNPMPTPIPNNIHFQLTKINNHIKIDNIDYMQIRIIRYFIGMIQFVIQEMDDSETSSIQFKSNYPLENYFLPGRTSLELSRGLSGSQSSNLFSPGQQLMASDEYDQFQQDAFGPQY